MGRLLQRRALCRAALSLPLAARPLTQSSSAASLSPPSYASVVREMYALNHQRRMRVGLHEMRRLLAALPPSLLSLPERPAFIHVTGSNGKGSVVCKLAAALSALGLRVGCFTSPHLSTARERVVVDGRLISERAMAQQVTAVLQCASRAGLQPTLFELYTALALVHFQQAAVDCAVLEVGLGGLRDATNVIPPPLLSVVTSIGLEHAAIIGPTLDDIAREKCGIFKQGSSAVVGPTVPLAIAEAAAAATHSRLVRVTGRFHSFDDENEAVALQALAVLREEADSPLNACMRARGLRWDEAVIRRAVSARPPCRYQTVLLPSSASSRPLLTVLDVAHNPPAFVRLLQRLRADHPLRPVSAVVGMSADKELQPCIAQLLTHCRQLHLVSAVNSPRAASVAQLEAAVAAHRQSQREQGAAADGCTVSVTAGGDVSASVAAAVLACDAANRGLASEADCELLLITGSFFIFRDALRQLRLDLQTTDELDLNEAALADAQHSQRPPASAGAAVRLGTALPSSSAAPAAAAACRAFSTAASSSSSSSLSQRVRVLRLYRHLLHLARHVRSPLTATPVRDVRAAFRANAALQPTDARCSRCLQDAASKLAFLRSQVPVSQHRRWAEEQDGGEPQQPAEQAQHGTASAAAAPSASAGSYERIFGSGDSGSSSSADGVSRFVFDAASSRVVSAADPAAAFEEAGGRRPLQLGISNSQGITDEQRKRHARLMERYHFRGDYWKKKGPYRG